MVQLVKKAQKGNMKAYLTLFQTFEEDLYRMAFLYVKNEQDALDIVQETAYRSFKSIKNLKEPEHVKTWLFKIVINCSFDLLRKRKKVLPLTQPIQMDWIGRIEEDLDLKIAVREIIDLLNEDEKTVIFLRFYEDLTFKEISEILDIPLGTAKTIFYRALEKLRKKVKGVGVE
ncbi:sigma-70 family RNA polymerase sigma factor [Fervidibacillus halotolerans]|uniref:Sigma-70 family RNA polymerase sigma factor n=1 Tax=Fervidibacillus halotolerans TaxID=2980027 RepID=A0A9E8S096_9BACI|nr:sigma-70 family RNA polymerase sigma factor [Fervidibacillus halotolerans]WAA13994.1 sigma-70 family RNA polymerase sigma factor [Fervidibacillus halotolerans]